MLSKGPQGRRSRYKTINRSKRFTKFSVGVQNIKHSKTILPRIVLSTALVRSLERGVRLASVCHGVLVRVSKRQHVPSVQTSPRHSSQSSGT
jgi:hypothetical protein